MQAAQQLTMGSGSSKGPSQSRTAASRRLENSELSWAGLGRQTGLTWVRAPTSALTTVRLSEQAAG